MTREVDGLMERSSAKCQFSERARRNAEFGVKQFRATETEKDYREQIRGRAQHQVGEPGDDRTEWPDEVLGGTIRRGELTEPDPRRNVPGRVRD